MRSQTHAQLGFPAVTLHPARGRRRSVILAVHESLRHRHLLSRLPIAASLLGKQFGRSDEVRLQLLVDLVLCTTRRRQHAAIGMAAGVETHTFDVALVRPEQVWVVDHSLQQMLTILRTQWALAPAKAKNAVSVRAVR